MTNTIELEQALLGLTWQDPNGALLDRARTILNGGQEFQRPAHQDLWALTCQLHDHGTPIDSATITAHVIRTPALLRALGETGPSYIHDCFAAGGHLIGQPPEHYAQLVKDQHRLRLWKEQHTRLGQLIEDGDPDRLDIAALDLIEQATHAIEQAHQTDQPNSWAAQPLDGVLDGQDLDPPPTMIERTDGHALLYDDAVHMISGESETAKTWFVLHGAVDLMRAGHQVTMIDFEDRATSVVQRLLKLGATPTQLAGPNPLFHYVRPTDPLTDTAQPHLHQACQGSRLVIIDGVTEAMALHGYSINDNDDTAHFYGLLPRKINTDTHAAILMIDHVTKDQKEKQSRYSIGAQHKLAGIDLAYQIAVTREHAPGKHGISRITISKDRYGRVREHAFGLNAGEFHLDATDPNCTRTWIELPSYIPKQIDTSTFNPDLAERISRYIEQHPDCPTNDITKYVRGPGSEITAIRANIKHLSAGNWIDIIPGPGKRHQHRTIHPYRDTNKPDPDPDDTPNTPPPPTWTPDPLPTQNTPETP